MMQSKSKAFTMIEMLFVMAIIMILVAMLLPAVNMMLRQAKRKQALSETKTIAMAIKRYRTAYSKWPNQTQGLQDTTYDNPAVAAKSPARIIDAMTNDLSNPRHMSFIDIPEGVLVDGCYNDPWGVPYVIAIDENDDGTSHVNVASVMFTTNINDTVAVLSFGPDSADEEMRIYSWH